MRARARRHGIAVLVVSAVDPVWAAKPDWLERKPALYASAHVRILETAALVP